MTDAEITQAVESWCELSEHLRYDVSFHAGTIRFRAQRGASSSGTLLPRSAIEDMEPEAFDSIRVALDFALSTSRAAVHIAGGFSRS